MRLMRKGSTWCNSFCYRICLSRKLCVFFLYIVNELEIYNYIMLLCRLHYCVIYLYPLLHYNWNNNDFWPLNEPVTEPQSNLTILLLKNMDIVNEIMMLQQYATFLCLCNELWGPLRLYNYYRIKCILGLGGSGLGYYKLLEIVICHTKKSCFII